MNTTSFSPTASALAETFETAKRELTKLPLLGPALWLYARDAQRRFTFVADIDWRLMPPLVLDQCRLFSKSDMPWSFVTWAFVGDAADQRLRSAAPVIAPHEWKGGEHPWLIDVVAPFGDAEAVAREVAGAIAPGRPVGAWLPNAAGQPAPTQLYPHA